MTDAYTDFTNSNDQEGNEDDDIGALGSILSWDEDEDGGVVGGNTAQSSNAAGSSALPDLVSFNSKDGTVNTAYLQQLLGATNGNGLGGAENKSGNDTSNLTIPMPTPINFGRPQSQTRTDSSQNQGNDPAGKLTVNPLKESETSTSPNTMIPSQASAHLPQHLQQQQQAASQAGASQHQGQPQVDNSTNLSNLTQAPRPPQQQLLPAVSSAQQQQSQATQGQQGPAPQVSAGGNNPQAPSASIQQNLVQQGPFSLFQQGALLAQQTQAAKQPPLSIRPAIPAMMMQNNAPQGSQDQRAEQPQQQQQPQFTFTADPTAFLRQLQVAQLQQQFNAVQQQQAQGRSLTQQIIASAQAPPIQQQQISFQQQQQVGVAASASAPSSQPPPTKKARSQAKKGQSSADTKGSAKQSEPAVVSKHAIVSASDTDGELSTKVGTSVPRAKKGSASTSANAKQEPLDMSDMTPEEKATANRDRNREHARNTRLRKKAYLEKLKTTVDELCKERDTLVSERAGAASILVEMHNTRTEVLMSFFALRSANEKRRELWASILDESCFACVLPVTPYRSFPASEVQVSKCQRTILGIDGMMADTASLHVLLNSLVDRSRFPNATIQFRYTLVTEEAVVAGNQMMARWVMTTLNATQCGARMEIAKQGMLCCKFNSAHKIIGLELMFDVMALMLQLKQAAGSDTFSVIPNTVQTCQRTFDMPMVMTLADEPYTIVQVNKLWEDMTGYKAEDVVGKASLRSIEGEETDPSAVEALMNEIRFKRPASAMVVNYKKSGERFRNFFMAFPLSTDSRITHYLHLSSHVDAFSGSSSTSQPLMSHPRAAAVAGEQPSHSPNEKSATEDTARLNPVVGNSFHPAPALQGGVPSTANGSSILSLESRAPGNGAAMQQLPSEFSPKRNPGTAPSNERPTKKPRAVKTETAGVSDK